jgi:hypothetical protein
MSKPASGQSGLLGLGIKLERLILEIVRRVYAVGMIALVTWLSYRALWYLLGTLMFPSATPEQIVGIPKRLTAEVLKTHRASWEGLQASATPRTPLAHYHRMDTWFQPDPYNNCTTSGCHEALPHSRNTAVRAFLNMHALTLQCGVCHMQAEKTPLTTVWYDLHSGKPRGAPTLLAMYAWLESDEGKKETAQPTEAVQDKIVGYLRQAIFETEADPTLTVLAERVNAVHYASPEFQQIVAEIHATLPLRFRGEYGVKLARRDADGRPIFGYPDTAAAIQQYLRAAPIADATRKQALLNTIHAGNRVEPVYCAGCHQSEGGAIDFKAAGYPPARIAMLSQPIIFRMIENIAAGQPFYLPGFVAPPEQRENSALEPPKP